MPFRRAPNCATGPLAAGAEHNMLTRQRGPSPRRATATEPRSPARFQARVPDLTWAVTPARYARRRDGRQRRPVVSSGGRPRARRLCGAVTPVRQGQPLRQPARGIGGCLAVERHHRRRHTGDAAQLRAPAVPHRHHLDVIRPPGNGLVKTMHSHVSRRPSPNRSAAPHARGAGFAGRCQWSPCGRSCVNAATKRVEFYARAFADQAKGSAKNRPHPLAAAVRAGIGTNIFSRRRLSTGFAPVIHRIST